MTRLEAIEQLAAKYDATDEIMGGGPYRYLAIFEDAGRRVLRDYSDEWMRDTNAPDDALCFRWNVKRLRYIRQF